MKKHPVNREEISTLMVWAYSVDNLTNDGRKIVLSRRYLDEFTNIFDEFRIRGVSCVGSYIKDILDRNV